MIRPLRRRHATLVLTVAAVVPAVVVLALGMRPALPVEPAPAQPPATGWTAIEPLSGIRALLESQAGREWLHLSRGDTVGVPDLLVYWSVEVPVDGALPADAVLLGALGEPGVHSFDLPARGESGRLLLYSLGHQVVAAGTPMTSIARRSVDH